MRDLSLVLAACVADVWAIEPRRGVAIAQVLARRSAGIRLAADEVARITGPARIAREEREAAASAVTQQRAGVAVIPIVGTLVHRDANIDASEGGFVSVESIRARFRAAIADPNVSAVILDVDSPGGAVDGIEELASEIAATEKPVIAVANTWAASAAYWIASQCAELIVTPSGEVGSIGVYTVHEDLSRALEEMGVTATLVKDGENKAATHPYFPLSEAARADLQRRVSETGVTFTAAVAKGRGVTSKRVRSEFGQGLMFGAKEAVKRGMADKVATLDETIARFLAGGKVKKREAVAEPSVTAQTPAPASAAELRRRELERLHR